MNIFVWVLQILLALHTIIGAVWKFSHTAEETMSSLSAIPSGVWMGLCVLELICGLCLIIPAFKKDLARLAPIAATALTIEMLLFCGVHLKSGDTNNSSLIYWLVVAAISAFIAYFRFARKPF